MGRHRVTYWIRYKNSSRSSTSQHPSATDAHTINGISSLWSSIQNYTSKCQTYCLRKGVKYLTIISYTGFENWTLTGRKVESVTSWMAQLESTMWTRADSHWHPSLRKWLHWRLTNKSTRGVTSNKKQITVHIAASASGHYIKPLIVYPGMQP